MSGADGRVLHVDWTRCRGRGLCTELLDGLDRDEWGYPVVTTGGSNLPLRPEHLADAREAVALCPLLALSIREPDRARTSSMRGGR